MDDMGRCRHLAVFVTPHGFGHAARASAVMAALRRLEPSLKLSIFSTAPQWFFEESISGPLHFESCASDIGLVQDQPMMADLEASLAALEAFYPPAPALLDELAARLQALGVEAVLCDIAPLGLAVAERAGLPSVLLENFCWDFIYRELVDQDARFGPVAERLGQIQSLATVRCQTVPVCEPIAGAPQFGPISRRARRSAQEVRAELPGAEPGRPLALLTFGGFRERNWSFLERVGQREDWLFVCPGAGERRELKGNLLELPHAGFYHPDLVQACDLVVGKVGYSTLAECLGFGVPLWHLVRYQFAEAGVLSACALTDLPGSRCLDEAAFRAGQWVDELPDVPFPRSAPRNDDERFARSLLDIVERGAHNPIIEQQ